MRYSKNVDMSPKCDLALDVDVPDTKHPRVVEYDALVRHLRVSLDGALETRSLHAAGYDAKRVCHLQIYGTAVDEKQRNRSGISL
jgi:hypothetical protein